MLGIILTFISGIILLWVVYQKPKYFYPLLIFTTITTGGLMIPTAVNFKGYTLSYCFADEYILICLLIGAIFAILSRKVPLLKEKTNLLMRIYIRIFILMCIYMIIQAIRGIIVWHDLRIIRWVIYYLILALLSFILSTRDFFVPSVKKILLYIFLSSFIYFILYLGHGFLFEILGKTSRFSLDVQGNFWSGSSYAVFPIVIAFLAVIFLINSQNYYKNLGWILWIIAIFIILYYDSRMGFWTVFAFIIFSISANRFRKTILLLLFYLVIFVFYYGQYYYLSKINKYSYVKLRLTEHLVNVINFGGNKVNLDKLGNALFLKKIQDNKSNIFNIWFIEPNKFDLDRTLNIQAAFMAVQEKPETFLFGYGIHSSHYIMVPYLKQLYSKYISWAKMPKIVWTMGFPALLVDTGWIGILFLLFCFFLCAYGIFNHTKWKFKTYRYILLLSLGIIFLWQFVTNILDFILFYFLIMPDGLIMQLAKNKQNDSF